MNTSKQTLPRCIAVLIHFHSHTKKLLQEVLYFCKKLDADLTLIVFEKKEDVRVEIHELIESTGIREHTSDIFWEKQQSIKRVLEICQQQKIDLLINKVQTQQNLLKGYLQKLFPQGKKIEPIGLDGFSRKLLKNAFFSVLLLPKSANNFTFIEKIVLHIKDKPKKQNQFIIQKTLYWSDIVKASKIYLMKEVDLIGLNTILSTKTEETSTQIAPKQIINDEKDKIVRLIAPLEKHNRPVEVEISSGKIGIDLEQFIRQTNAELLVVDLSDFKPSLISKVLNSQLEYILSNLSNQMLFVYSQN